MTADYLIHLEKIQQCLACKFEYCIYDKVNDENRNGCQVEGKRKLTLTEVMAKRNGKIRIAAFEKINEHIAQGKILNLKQAASLTGLSTATMSQYVKRGLLKVERARYKKGYNIIEAVINE